MGLLETPCWRVLLISMHHSEHKGLKTNVLPGLLMSCCVEYIKDFLKKKASSTNDPSIWKQFQDARNKANNSVKKAKRKCFSDNLDANKSDPRKTWRLINELQSRQSKSTSVSSKKQKTKFSPHLVILLKHLIIILQT